MNNGTIRRAPGGGWIADVRVNGKRRQLAAKTKAEAKERFDQEVQRLLDGTVEPKPRPAAKNKPKTSKGLTLGAARDISLRTRWQGAYRSAALIYSQQVVDWFGEATEIESITASQIKDFRLALQAKGNENTTINKKVLTLRAMATDALEEGLIERVPPFPRPLPAGKNMRRALTDQEIQAFCRFFVDNGYPVMADIFVLTLDTCSRWSDVAKLRSEDVDLTRRTVTFYDTKNGDTRTVGLTPRSLEILQRNKPAHPRQLIFNMPYRQSNKLVNKAKEALGLADDRRVVFHSLRHTAATRLTMSGMPQMKAMRFGGWRDPKVFGRYNHLAVEDLQDCTNVLSQVGVDKSSSAEWT